MKFNFCHFLANCLNVSQVKSLLSILISTGRIRRRHFLEQFLGTCFRLNAPDLALATFTTVNKQTVAVQNLMLRGLGDNRLYEDALSLYKQSRALGCPSDDFTFPIIIKACSILGAFRSGEQIHGLVLRSGYGQNVVVSTTLVDLYAKCGVLDSARQLFDEIPQPDLVSLNALLAGYSLHQLDQQASEVFKRVFSLGLHPNSTTLATVIPVCGYHFGRSVHGFAVKSGCSDDLAAAFISMYAGSGGTLQLSAARTLFDDCSPEKKTIAVWNSMISAYTRNQKPEPALEMFVEMLGKDVKPDLITFVSIIPSSCSSCAESLHGFVIKHGSESKVPVTTALVSMYAKLWEIRKAELLFNSMVNKKTLLSWNVMVSGYVDCGLWHEALSAFREMQKSGGGGFIPDSASIVTILTACSKTESFLLGKSAHGFSLRKGLDLKTNVSNAILAFYSGFGHLITHSLEVFRAIEAKDTISWNSIISACVRNGEVEAAVRLFRKMQNEPVGLDSITLITILPVCFDLVDGMAIHCYAIKSGFDSDVSLVNALISMYSRCEGEEEEEEEEEGMEMGRLLFERMARRTVVSWNALISGYSNRGRGNEVSVLFGRMMAGDHRPNWVTLMSLLHVCSSPLQVKSVHGFSLRTGILIPLLSSLIAAYARFDDIESSDSLFDSSRMYNDDLSVWNAIISAHVQTRNPGKGFELFCSLLESGSQPDHITLLGLISASSQLNSSNLLDSILSYTIRKGFGSDSSVITALIDSYSKTGNLSSARTMFETENNVAVTSWNAMINGYGLHGDGKSALDLFHRMENRPDHATFTSVLSACSHAGLVSEGRAVFESMDRMGYSPRIEQYGCLVDMLSRGGYLEEAVELVEELIRSGSNRVGARIIERLADSVLGGCRVYGNVEIAERVYGMMTWRSSEGFVLLSNVYAGGGRWGDVVRVRSKVERKPPGFSSVW